jgi:pimeloyl-ACP methyl ester carboxylesterase
MSGEVETTARWFGPPERPLLGWVTAGREAARASGVAIAAPVGYAQLTSHRALRRLAEELAADGHVVLRFDYDGTGDSAGDQWDPGRPAAWRASLAAAAAELRALGCETLTLVGLRLGATFALVDGGALGADAVVAWLPVTSGRRYAKEIRLMSTELPPEHHRDGDAARALAGDVFTAATLAELVELQTQPSERPAPRVLLVDDAADPSALRELGSAVDAISSAGSEGILETTAENAQTPEALLASIREWLGPPAAPPLEPPAGPAHAELDWRGEQIRETVLRLGPHGLAAVATERAAGAPGAPTLLLLNSGSEPHFGPGRAWVAFARELALRGYRAVRADFRGWGESPADGLEPVPYSDHCREDVVAMVRALEQLGHDRVLPFGLCSAAWVALKVAVDEPLAGVIALNPQLYWTPGYTIDLEQAYLDDERLRDERFARLGVWSLLDAVGARAQAGRWLDGLRRSNVPVTLLYAAGDKGIRHLRARHGRRLASTLRQGRVRLVEVPEIDHAMHRVWLRGAIVDALEAALAEAAEPAAERAHALTGA